jgi:hypothetical protein
MVPAGLARSKPENADTGMYSTVSAVTNTAENAAGETETGNSADVTKPAVSNTAGTDSALSGVSAVDTE